MKFDFIIGNPPYQDETLGDNKGFAPPIYHKFLENAYEVADVVEMIHPARFLFNAGSTPKEWNNKMLQNEHLKILYYEADATKIFPNTSITGGVAITYHDINKKYMPVEVFVPFLELNTIRQKVVGASDFREFGTIMSGRTPYLFTNEMHVENPCASESLSQGHLYDISSNAFVALPLIFLEIEPEDKDKYYRVLGRCNNSRVYRWIKKKYVRGRIEKYIGTWKIFLPKANGASGMLGYNGASTTLHYFSSK